MVCSKKYRDKCKPHNTRGVHREPYVLRLVEVGGDLPGFDGVDGAEEDEDHVVDQGHDQGEGRHTTCLHSTWMVALAVHVNNHGSWRLNNQPRDHTNNLNAD